MQDTLERPPDATIDATPTKAARLKAGAVQTVRAGAKVAGKTVLYSGLGFFGSLVVTGAMLALGALDHGAPWWSTGRLLLLPVLALVSAWGFGMAGFTRGVGSVVRKVALEDGVLLAVMERALAGATERLRDVALAQRSAETVRDLPLQQVEEAVKRAVGESMSEGAEGGRAARAVRGVIARRAESLLLASVRQEKTERGGGGVDLAKVRARALAAAEAGFADLVDGTVSGKTRLLVALVVVAHATPPLVVYLLR